eukprot:scaffold274920_cov30-Tisochrysis_lutea.AAC.1
MLSPKGHHQSDCTRGVQELGQKRAGGWLTLLKQERHHVFVALPRCHVKWCMPLGVLRVEGGASLEEQFDDLHVS